ncbi:MAG: hypothetical protein ACTSUE_02780 [Promethearchaeota archaeon]
MGCIVICRKYEIAFTRAFLPVLFASSKKARLLDVARDISLAFMVKREAAAVCGWFVQDWQTSKIRSKLLESSRKFSDEEAELEIVKESNYYSPTCTRLRYQVHIKILGIIVIYLSI